MDTPVTRKNRIPPNPGFEFDSAISSLELLAEKDPAKALDTLNDLAESEFRSEALAAIAGGWAKFDLMAAVTWIEGLEPLDDQVSALAGLVPVWVARDALGCFEWSGTHPAGVFREMSFVETADAWTQTAPASAFSKFLSSTSEVGTERGLHTIVDQWATNEPIAAIDGIAALDPSGRRDEFLETALISLTNSNPALSWAEARKVGDPERLTYIRETALEAMAETSPKEALRLAATEEKTTGLLSAIGRGWALNEPEAARAWAASLKDPTQSEAVLKSISE